MPHAWKRDDAPCTLTDSCLARLRALVAATGLAARSTEIEDVARRLLAPWADALPPGGGAPFALSLRLGAAPELDVVVEPLGDPPSLHGNREAALAVLASLARDFDLDLAGVERVRGLMLPDRSLGSFAARIAAGFAATRPPRFALHLDPRAHGAHRAPAVVEEALARLGLATCWPVVGGAMPRGPELDAIVEVALDLSRTGDAGVQVHLRHDRATPEDLEYAASAASYYRPGAVRRFVEIVAPGGGAGFVRRSPRTRLAFVARDGGAISTATTHLPVDRDGSGDAGALERRIAAQQTELGLDAGSYPDDDAIGAPSYVSLQAAPATRLAVQLAAPAWPPDPIDAPGDPATADDLDAVIERLERRAPIIDHPFLRRLQREPVDLGHLWLVLTSIQILADQLGDLLGRGRFAHPHAGLFARTRESLAAFLPGEARDAERAEDLGVVAAGRDLARRLAAIYGADDVFEAVGAVIAGEIVGGQIDQRLAAEFRRATQIDAASLAWLTLHEALEVAHGDASPAVAQLIAPRAEAAACRGARAVFAAAWAFLDQLYAACHGSA